MPETVHFQADAPPGPGAPLKIVKDWLRRHLDEGARCPCCSQMAKVYRRTITAASARALIVMYQAGATERPVHLPTVLGRKQADETKMAYWGLIEEPAGSERPDGGRAGWWKITSLGEAWIKGAVSVPHYARVYDGRCLRLEGPPLRIEDALGHAFDLADLMVGV